MSAITPSEIARIRERATGPLRRYELEQRRATARTNLMYGKAVAPHVAALQSFADALAEVASRTHRIANCRVSSNWVTLQFPWKYKSQECAGGEISIHIPANREDPHPHCHPKWYRTFPHVTIRPPGATLPARRYQLSPNETPQRVWNRCARFFHIYAKASMEAAA